MEKNKEEEEETSEDNQKAIESEEAEESGELEEKIKEAETEEEEEKEVKAEQKDGITQTIQRIKQEFKAPVLEKRSNLEQIGAEAEIQTTTPVQKRVADYSFKDNKAEYATSYIQDKDTKDYQLFAQEKEELALGIIHDSEDSRLKRAQSAASSEAMWQREAESSSNWETERTKTKKRISPFEPQKKEYKYYKESI
ncbi:MAG TPA: hypothetical protein VJH65_03445 [Candidatus Nanoarchaeia archaeon]|nr:hypothetical protein [Candidatus Nanoarchaeia archaeon]